MWIKSVVIVKVNHEPLEATISEDLGSEKMILCLKNVKLLSHLVNFGSSFAYQSCGYVRSGFQ